MPFNCRIIRVDAVDRRYVVHVPNQPNVPRATSSHSAGPRAPTRERPMMLHLARQLHPEHLAPAARARHHGSVHRATGIANARRRRLRTRRLTPPTRTGVTPARHLPFLDPSHPAMASQPTFIFSFTCPWPATPSAPRRPRQTHVPDDRASQCRHARPARSRSAIGRAQITPGSARPDRAARPAPTSRHQPPFVLENPSERVDSPPGHRLRTDDSGPGPRARDTVHCLRGRNTDHRSPGRLTGPRPLDRGRTTISSSGSDRHARRPAPPSRADPASSTRSHGRRPRHGGRQRSIHRPGPERRSGLAHFGHGSKRPAERAVVTARDPSIGLGRAVETRFPTDALRSTVDESTSRRRHRH